MAPCLMRQVAGVSKGRSLNPILISAATFAVIGDIVAGAAKNAKDRVLVHDVGDTPVCGEMLKRWWRNSAGVRKPSAW